ncbi:uncharacterized protein LOC116198778 isoform X2 [Punica granatum]|uniref:Uncharacterized protein LOC116198778 isoform X2 n=1 Tax=Punica granatum TaxID=22663 RepID=A0A6P8CMY3_PUNGR|nr:uncharacterized protein LOC116198778 isoform X2 [Punica granatum]
MLRRTMWSKVRSFSSRKTHRVCPRSEDEEDLVLAPRFRVPCRTGTCKSPLQVTSSQLIASEFFPEPVVKALLYPGAVAASVLKKKALPSYNDLLKSYDSIHVKEVRAAMDLKRIEVLAGSYFMVAGALMSLIKPVRMSFFGALLVTWGLYSEVFPRKAAYIYSDKAIRIYPMMILAIVSAFSSMRKDLRKIIHICKKCRSKAKLV